MRILPTKAFIENKIPSIKDFKPASKQFELDCVIPFLGKEVNGGFSYGSVNRSDCNVASDVDYLMIISDNKHKKKIRQATKRVYEEKNIYIQTRVTHVDDARAGFHTLDCSFRQHLDLCVAKHGYRGENPLEILAQNNIPFKESLRRSISNYLTKLNNGFTTHHCSDEEYTRFLKDIMEKPFHAMRVVIQFFLGTVAPKGIENFQDTKSELIKTYSELNLDNTLLDNIYKLRTNAAEYIALLKKRKAGEIQSDLEYIYSNMLDKIFDCYSVAFNFIEQNAKLIKE